MELLIQTKTDNKDLLRCHILGWPVFVIYLKLHGRNKIPKWNSHSWLGNILDLSDNNSSLVGNIQNFTTGYISPQYNFMFDDMFHKLCETGEYEVVIGSILNNIFEQNRDCCVEK